MRKARQFGSKFIRNPGFPRWALTPLSGTSPGSPELALDTRRIPVSKEKRRDRGGRHAGCSSERPDGPLRLVPRQSRVACPRPRGQVRAGEFLCPRGRGHATRPERSTGGQATSTTRRKVQDYFKLWVFFLTRVGQSIGMAFRSTGWGDRPTQPGGIWEIPVQGSEADRSYRIVYGMFMARATLGP
jgi:hypothetical protein